MTSNEVEQKTLAFLQRLYEIIDATGCEIHEINLKEVARSVGLKTIPTQDVLYGNFPTSIPTMEDAVRICNARRMLKCSKKEEIPILERDKLQKEATALANIVSELKREIGSLQKARSEIGQLRAELKEMRTATTDFAETIINIRKKYNN